METAYHQRPYYIQQLTYLGNWEPIQEGDFETLDAALGAMEDLEKNLGWRNLRIAGDDGMVEAWGRSVEDDQREELESVTSLKDLHRLLLSWEEEGGDLPEWLDTTELPTFGGEEPADTVSIWSWDENHVLYGDGPGDSGRIISREEWEEYYAK